jgi:hypothetical protein
MRMLTWRSLSISPQKQAKTVTAPAKINQVMPGPPPPVGTDGQCLSQHGTHVGPSY